MRGMSALGRVSAPWLAIGLLALAAGCSSLDRRPPLTDPAAYVGWSCERLFGGIDAVQQRAADVAYAIDARVGNNMIALGLGVTVFWPALLAMRPDGTEAAELAELKGRFEAMQSVALRQRCGPPPEALLIAGAPSRTVALGDRLVYENRAGHGGAVHELGMRVSALQRDQVEFAVDFDGRVLPQRWHQDLAGNPAAPAHVDLMGWQRLLRRDLQLGQVLSGELAPAHEAGGRARVRGQVVATGPQRIGGHVFDAAVIELFGDAPSHGGSTRLDGVMSVDRRSGVLLRLEVRCANENYALRRRLLRVEAGSSTGG
jgi:hypothetical protein